MHLASSRAKLIGLERRCAAHMLWKKEAHKISHETKRSHENLLGWEIKSSGFSFFIHVKKKRHGSYVESRVISSHRYPCP